MDSVFQLSKEHLLNLMHSFASSYICLWSYSPHHNWLYCKDGYYQERGSSSSSSSGMLEERRLFDVYKESFLIIQNDHQCVPGLAFKHRNPYLQLSESNLQMFSSTVSQRQFYKEARIKIAVFMGCDRGEIELGMSYLPQMNIEMKMQSLFPQYFSRHSSSSSLSIDSSNPDHASLILNTQTLPLVIRQPQNKFPSLPSAESVDAALAMAYLKVLSSATNSRPFLFRQEERIREKKSAFRRYESGSYAESNNNTTTAGEMQIMMKRVIMYLRERNSHRIPSRIDQLNHTIAERRRRERLKELFQDLRALLPPSTKKHRGCVLKTAIEELINLKAQLKGVRKMKQLPDVSTGYEEDRLSVWITPVSDDDESTSRGERMVDLQVRLRGHVDADADASSLIIRVLEFLSTKVREASLVSMAAQSHQHNQNPTSWVSFRLRIQGSEWDESALKEAIIRILAAMAQ